MRGAQRRKGRVCPFNFLFFVIVPRSMGGSMCNQGRQGRPYGKRCRCATDRHADTYTLRSTLYHTGSQMKNTSVLRYFPLVVMNVIEPSQELGAQLVSLFNPRVLWS
jgi:hypothetical protein